MNDRGEKRDGVLADHNKASFLLSADGGVIQVEANDPMDTATRDNIRMHLTHIAKGFASGDFAIPMFVHNTTSARRSGYESVERQNSLYA